MPSQSVITIQVINADEIAKRLLNPPTGRVDALTRKVANDIRRNVQTATPKRTGKLKAGIRTEMVAPAWYIITENERYGPWVRYGTQGGYSIFPQSKEALWWPQRGGISGYGADHPVAMIRMHPGIKNKMEYDRVGVERSAAVIDQWMYDIGKAYAGMLEYGAGYSDDVVNIQPGL
jgi:hypothetical protein